MKRLRVMVLALVLTVALAVPLAVPVLAWVPDTNPVLIGMWHLDDNAEDSGGNGLNGTETLVSYAGGEHGQALSVGTTGWISVPDNVLLEPSDITVEAWVKRLGSPGGAIYIVSKYLPNRHGGYSSYGLYTGSGGMRFYIGYTGSWIGTPQASAAAVWDG